MLYFITNRKLVSSGGLVRVIKEAVRGGVDAIILREKDLTYKELLPLAAEIKKITQDTNTALIVNRNLTVAKEINAEGYHTGFQEFMETKPSFEGFLGVSVHSVEEGILAEKQGAGYLLAGHVFETDCKKGVKPRGLRFIEEMRRETTIPIIALGGITPENAQKTIKTGAKGIAVMSSIMTAKDPYTLTQIFKSKLR
ncbi:thiamine phosphate synthase [Clostridium formicaceticum]|jgi:thiamine-phosphate pyrophosphorylase|uniref:Thiamine-phosphate synthase n=1 Tax=Clostridium formicaceticum TaxID=1497 RepID=A0AAC9RRY4_9CLOT|nr:thiamine phosphate synthase [Clostridium formicaceticum]AOY75244.1 thiamine phosphate synthase [Clostridium formicaceticum]ARE89678.1 Regulatory protein TenI [Clostridium formicaceticum]